MQVLKLVLVLFPFPHLWYTWKKIGLLCLTHHILAAEVSSRSPHIRFDLEKLKDLKIAEVFQARVGGKLAALCILDSDVNTLAKSLKYLGATLTAPAQQKSTSGLSQQWQQWPD